MKKILISNDDGVHAPGINVLYETLSKVADVTVVAPMVERSTTGHTLTIDDLLRLEQVSENVYGCSGYPADSSLLGFAHVLKDNRPDLVISGINRGANLGQDIYYSGTVAAAREATFHGIPAISISLDIDFTKKNVFCNFQTAANFMAKIIDLDIEKNMDPHTLLNINVPNVADELIAGHVVTNMGFRHYSEEIVKRVDSRGRDYHWIGGVYSGHDKSMENSDCMAVEHKKVSICPLDLLNQYPDLKPKWQKIFQAI